MKNYFELLGLDENCSCDQLENSYRILAKRYHPDVCSDYDSTNKFKKIQEAYDYLKKICLKKSEIDSVFDNVLNNILNSFKIRIKISLRESCEGCVKSIEIDKKIPCNFCKNKSCKVCNYRGFFVEGKENLLVQIPKGVEDGTQIRVQDKRFGDLFIIVNVEKNKLIKREKYDLHFDLEVFYSTLLLGGQVSFNIFEENMNVKIKPRTLPGSLIVLKNKGVCYLENEDLRGDLFLHIKIKYPKELNKDYKKIILDSKKYEM